MQAAPQSGAPPPKNTKPYPVSATTSSTNNVLSTTATLYEPPSITLTNPDKPLSPKIQDKTTVLALDKALVFLSDTTQLLDYGSYTLANYLHRKFGIKQVYTPQGTKYRIQRTYANKEIAWQPFVRLIDAKAPPLTWEAIHNTQSDIDSLILQALWSDKLELDKTTYYAFLQQFSHQGKYELTHALLACMWLEETRFTNVSSDEYLATKQYLIQRIKEEVLADVNFWGDVEIEAVALLQYADERQAIKPEWIKGIINQQQADGGWVFYADKTESSVHSTSLAIWALLEYTQTPLQSTTWINF